MVDEVRIARLLRAARDDMTSLQREGIMHDYVDVDDAIVLAKLADVSDLDDFTRAVGGWLADSRFSGSGFSGSE